MTSTTMIRRSYTAQQKLKVIDYAYQFGAFATKDQFDIDHSMIYRWSQKCRVDKVSCECTKEITSHR
jgi:hypothetical protein